jgi:hypothetical protein
VRAARALRGQAVEGRRFDFLLAVTAEIAVTEIVGEDEDDVGRRAGAAPPTAELTQPTRTNPASVNRIKSLRFIAAIQTNRSVASFHSRNGFQVKARVPGQKESVACRVCAGGV